MSTMLERMRARVQERQPSYERDYSIYAFWNMKFGASSTLRLIPYNDPYTGAFWAEKVMLPMQFEDPQDPSKVVKFLAPCREMYDHANKCPILGPVRDLYAEEKELRNSGNSKEADKLKKIAGFHWKKPTYYYQGFVNKSGMAEDELPENPIRVFPFNKKIHQIIYSSIFESDEDPFDTLPVGEFTMDDITSLLDGGEVNLDIFQGFNFIVKKAKQGEFAEWTTGSGWSKSTSSLTEEQLAALAEHGIHDLTKRLPDRPSDEQYDVLAEMMDISVKRMVLGENGVWNPEWEELGFKPVRPRKNDQSESTANSKPAEDSSSDDATTEGSGTANALERLKKARGKVAASTEEDSPAEIAAADDAPAEATNAPAADAPPLKDGETGVTALAAKIQARVRQKSA